MVISTLQASHGKIHRCVQTPTTLCNLTMPCAGLCQRQLPYQLTDKPTRKDTILDLTLTSNPDIISNLETHPGMSEHCAVSYDVDLSVKRQKKPDRYVYQYKKRDIEGVKRDMGEFQDTFLSEYPYSRSVDDNWNRLKQPLSNPWTGTSLRRR